ncbi:MAG: DUF2953 domain-containing protein [Lachnospiraceae bacterium]|nr:DUF2953 domain-containing protein [Lachnospiraceae bacterium]MDE7239439.1 DUF2953 domain-containing protein [Lachnospiraceae bacterium]
MIHILLLLLKIIGITLLSLLGLILLIILVVLFVPIRYSLNVKADKSVEARACVSWLLHLLHATAVYDGTFGIVIRVFGISVKRIPAPEEKKPKKSKEKQKEKKRPRGEETEQTQDRDDTGSESVGETDAGETADVNQTESETKTAAGEVTCSGPDGTAVLSETVRSEGDKPAEADSAPDTNKDDTGSEGEKKEKLSLFQKLVQFIRAVRAFFSKILYTIQNICGKIEKVKELIGYYSEVLKSEEGQRTFALAKRELGRLLKHIAPTKLRGSLTIGMGDPAATGQIIAIVSMFYPIYGNNVSITADFEEKCMRGSLYLKGRIRIITLIRIAWRVYFNKDVKTFLHMLKREENEA